MTAEPTPNPDEPDQRPELHVVRDTNPDPEAEVGAVIEEPAEPKVPPETPAETTGPVPVLDADGQPVTAKAPLDVRTRQALLNTVRGLPLLSDRPVSFRESLDYSQTGDWAASDNTAKRVAHGLATVVAYLVTYPVVDVLGRFRTKPIGFVLALALLFTVLNVL